MANDTVATRQHQLKVSRVFPASREQVFAAWSSAEHVKHWFCPQGFTVPHATVEFHPGGAFDVCMRAPDGQEHWTRGHFLEVVPPARLVIDMTVPGADGEPLFSAHTTVVFTSGCGGTHMEVEQAYTLFHPLAEQMVKGAQMGWEQTLDRLGRALEYTQQPAAHSVVHGSFRIERHFDVPRERVWSAFTDQEAKARWFGGGNGQTILARTADIRPGGREHVQGRWGSGTVSTFDAVYFDVVPNERLVYSYEMHLDQRKISVSLATLELKQDGAGTLVVMSEHGAFLDGYDDAGSRERGTNLLLDAVGQYLKG
ncbi:hypothetical protein GCM10027320_06190 [Massilia solisilvae]